MSYSPAYHVPLPAGHPFPMAKFPSLHRILLREGLIREADVVAPAPADWSDLRLAHTEGYLGRLRRGQLGPEGERRLGLPWSEALVRRSRLAVQGTLNAAWMAIRDGVAANLAGGTHHAFPDRGEGFCVLNDVAVTLRALRRAGWVRRALVIDLDVHQGDATAHVFRRTPGVFTCSLHGARNYPFRKRKSSLDVPLPDGTSDGAYLGAVDEALGRAFEAAAPDLVFYLAGVDPAEGDRYGRLSLTPTGLRERDARVLEACARRDVPVALLLSGGYASSPVETADLHAQAHRAARDVFGP